MFALVFCYFCSRVLLFLLSCSVIFWNFSLSQKRLNEILIYMCMLHIELTCFWQLNIRYWSCNTNGVKLFHPALAQTLVHVPSLQTKLEKFCTGPIAAGVQRMGCHFLHYSFGVWVQHKCWNTLISSIGKIPSANGDSNYPPAKAHCSCSHAALLAANEHLCKWDSLETFMSLISWTKKRLRFSVSNL